MNFPTERDLKWLRTCVRSATEFSTCAKAQYFAVIVDTHGHVLGTGYNGSPSGMPHCADGACPRAQQGAAVIQGYGDCISVHSEANALLHSDYSARRDGSTLYVNGRPCWDCAKLVAGSGIKRIVALDEANKRDYPKVEEFLEAADVTLILVDSDDL